MSLVLIAIAVALVSWAIWKFHTHPVQKLPGPFALPLIGNMLSFVSGREAAFATFNRWFEKYRPLYRTWHGPVPTLHALDPHNVEVILSSSIHINKSFDYKFLTDWLGTGLLISTGSKWHSRRKLLTPAFHFSILEQFVPVFCEKSKILVSNLKDHKEVDIVPLVTRCALDIICDTAMGTNVNAQIQTDSPYVTAVYDISEAILHRILRPWLWPDWCFKVSPTGKRFKHNLDVLHGFTRKVIREQREILSQKTNIDGKRKTAFLDLLIQASAEDSTITDEDIREEVDTFMFEGHDTTAMAMSWTLCYLGIHHEIQELCSRELDEIFCGSKRDPTLSDLTSMKYLERVIKETLRLRPSVVLIARQIIEPIKIENILFPAGTKLNIQIQNIHRNPEIFPDPEKFDPDRFLPENCVNRHPYAYVPFSAGPRNCIGQKFAMLEMKSVLSSLLRQFHFTTLQPEKSLQALPDIILRPMNGVQMKITNRK